jgi:hypothetical protein
MEAWSMRGARYLRCDRPITEVGQQGFGFLVSRECKNHKTLQNIF